MMLTPRAEKIIKNHVILSVGIAAIPLAYFNLHMVRRIQLDMIKQLCRLYGQSYYEVRCKAYIGSLASTGLARKSLSYTRGYSGLGKIMGSVSHAGLSAASTYAVGQVTARFFQDNIELADINMNMARGLFVEELEKGKTFAQRIFSKKGDQQSDRNTERNGPRIPIEKSIHGRLIQLKALRDRDILTEEEYEQQRLKYLKKFDW